MLIGDYSSTIGQRVLDSFNPNTYPGDQNRSAELGVNAGIAAGLGGLGYKAAPYVSSLLSKMTPYVDDVVARVGKASGAEETNSITKTGTVFDAITPTQSVYTGSVIPRSFEMSLSNGQRVWVAGNATEHLAEYAQMKALNYTPDAVRLASQEQLVSLQSAVNVAIKNGVPYNQILSVDGWELKFAPPRQLGQLPSLIHALQR